MERRAFFAATACASFALAGCGAAEVRTFPTIAAAQTALDGLFKTPHRTTGIWKLPQMLEHAAQSVEFSLGEYPEMKPAWFRATVGAAAFAVFEAKGSMHHGLDEPIPGAPALGAPALDRAAARLKTALDKFAAHRGRLAPHFAYGDLTHAEYTRAHLMHLANHWSEIVRG